MDTQTFYEKLDNMFAERRFNQIEKFISSVLTDAENSGEYELAVAACNELGGFFRATSRYEEGIVLYQKALEYLEILGLENSENYATTMINYATILNFSGADEEAIRAYEKATRILKICGIEADYRTATLYNNMSSIYCKKGELQTAAVYLNKAMLILENLSESEIEIAITYSNLANIYRKAERLDEAEAAAKKAISGFIEKSGDSDVHYAAAVCALAEVYFAKKKYEEAADLFDIVAKLTERDYGRDNDAYRTIMHNVQLCIDKMGEQSKQND